MCAFRAFAIAPRLSFISVWNVRIRTHSRFLVVLHHKSIVWFLMLWLIWCIFFHLLFVRVTLHCFARTNIFFVSFFFLPRSLALKLLSCGREKKCRTSTINNHLTEPSSFVCILIHIQFSPFVFRTTGGYVRSEFTFFSFVCLRSL